MLDRAAVWTWLWTRRAEEFALAGEKRIETLGPELR